MSATDSFDSILLYFSIQETSNKNKNMLFYIYSSTHFKKVEKWIAN